MSLNFKTSLHTRSFNLLRLALTRLQHYHTSGTRLNQNSPDIVYILSASRTPIGTFNGCYTRVSAPQIGAWAIKSALDKLPPSVIDQVSHVYMGQVLQANCQQAPARHASLLAGLPSHVDATTVNKVCSSGLKAVTIAAQSIALREANVLVAGGMENMTRVPYYLPRSSQLPPFGNVKLTDGLIGDGLWDVYNDIHMGMCAENTAKSFKISRQDQDEFAKSSFLRAQAAWDAGHFSAEVVPITIPPSRGSKPLPNDSQIMRDEGYTKLVPEKLSLLKPAFDTKSGQGTITAANSSSLSDGASAVVLGNYEAARQFALNNCSSKTSILSRIVCTADAAVDPIDFPIAPAKAISKVLEKSGINITDISVFELNEAFAAVVIANTRLLGLSDSSTSSPLPNVNPRGGAIALGHPLGSSGCRILVTLLHQLKPGQYGIAAICNGGGAATAVLVQRITSV